jgi:hypothetical protein
MAQRDIPPSHIPISMAARPARLGLLVPADITGLPWPQMFEAALATQSRFWGGSGNLVFPLTKRFAENEVFWVLAEIFDADAWLHYTPTVGEMEHLDPRYYATQVNALTEQMGEAGDTQIAAQFLSDLRSEPCLDVKPTDDEIAAMRSRLIPIGEEEDGAIAVDSFDGVHAAGWPFTDIGDFDDFQIEKIFQPLAPSGAARKLLMTAKYGRATETFSNLLAGRGIAVEDFPLDRFKWARAVTERDEMRVETPWTLSATGISRYGSPARRGSPAALVVGNSPWDFTLYYALTHLTGSAWWLPSWLARDDAYVMSLARALRHAATREGREAIVVSTSSMKQRDIALAKIASLPGSGKAPHAGDWKEALPSEPLQFYVSGMQGRTRLLALADNEVPELDTPIPRRPKTADEAQMRWIAEVRGPNWAPIRHQKLAGKLLPQIAADHHLARTSRGGVAYFPSSSFVLTGESLDSAVRRPGFRPLSLEDQLKAALVGDGWSLGPSDKGIYAEESMALFGGYEELCSALLDSRVRAVMDAFLKVSTLGPKLSVDGRRYLTLKHFLDLLGEDSSSVLRPLIDAGVLIRGTVLKCARCRQIAWHRARYVTDQFACDRCDHHQPATRESWFGTDEPIQSYRLAEVVFQFLENHGELPLLGTREAFQRSRRPAGRSFELELTSPEGRKLEIDIFHSDGSQLWIGEASISGRFSADRLRLLHDLATKVNAAGVLLLTSKGSWSSGTAAAAHEIFSEHWIEVKMRSSVLTSPAP